MNYECVFLAEIPKATHHLRLILTFINGHICFLHSPPKYWGQMVSPRGAASLVSALELLLELQEPQAGRGKEDPVWVGSPVKETS